MSRNKNKKKKKEHFNDLIIPIILILCVMPFVIRMAEYDYGFGKYPWHSENSVMQDFYTYYRSIFFITVICIVVAILAFWLLLYRGRIKPSKIFFPLLIYGALALISSVLSVNTKASFMGNLSYESVFVLLGYVVIAFYTYQILDKENDYKVIVRAVMIMFTLMSIVGWFQVFRHDMLNSEWVQKLVMNNEQFAEYGGMIGDVFTGNNVFLSLYNPNYAAIFLVMFASVFAVFLLEAKTRKERVLFAVYLADALVLCWFTYTRAALVAFVAVAVLFVMCLREKDKRIGVSVIFAGVVFIVIGLVCVDGITGGRYINRMIDKSKTTKLENIETKTKGVEITYDGRKYILTMEAVKDGEIQLPFSEGCYATSIEWDGETILMLYIENYTLQFIKKEDGYYYYTEWGKTDKMSACESVDFGGKEYLGSGRVYIWSRVLPLLKHYIIVGSGPDTFAEVYPQDDYVGKMIYSESTARIIEGAHNDYLMRWVQTGLVSLISILVFYVLFFVKCFRHYSRCSMNRLDEKLGFGCFLGCNAYMVCSIFSDSTLYTTPIFYIFIGIALSVIYRKENE